MAGTLRLKSIENVRAQLACTYRELKAGTLEPGMGRVRIYCLYVLANVIQTSDLEKRIEQLESQGVDLDPATNF